MTAPRREEVGKSSGTADDHARPSPSLYPGRRGSGGLGVPGPTVNRHRIAALLGGAALAMATGGCGSGSTATVPPSTMPSGSTGQASGMTTELRRVEADPCRILAEKAARLGVGSGTLVTSSTAIGGQACRLTNFPDKPDTTPGKTYLVQVMNNPATLTVDNEAMPSIGGFPTQRGTPSGATPDNTCVDVLNLTSHTPPDQSTPNQPPSSRYLWIQYSNLARDNPTLDHQMACNAAAAAALAAITSLNQMPG